MSARVHARICIYVRTFVIIKMYCTSGQRLRHAISPTLSIVFPIRFAIANNSTIFYIERSLLNRENANVVKILNISKSILRYNKVIQYKTDFLELINIYKIMIFNFGMLKNNYFLSIIFQYFFMYF